MGSASQMWALWSPPLFRFRDGDGNLSSLGELLCSRHKFRQTTGVDWCVCLRTVCVCEIHIYIDFSLALVLSSNKAHDFDL